MPSASASAMAVSTIAARVSRSGWDRPPEPEGADEGGWEGFGIETRFPFCGRMRTLYPGRVHRTHEMKDR